MSGWNYFAGKSNRAVAAETSGLLPKSKINQAWLDQAGISESVGFIKWLIKHNYIAPAEWHHTSTFCNRTDYYDDEYIVEQLEEMPYLDMLRDMYADPKWRNTTDRFNLSAELGKRRRAAHEALRADKTL